MTFAEWVIAKYIDEDSPRGDFARDVRDDHDRPKENTKQAWKDRLYYACHEAREVFEKLWKHYERYRKVQDGKRA